MWKSNGNQTSVVTLKIPGYPGNKEASSIAAGSVTTRLFGRFPSLKKIFVVFNAVIVESNQDCDVKFVFFYLKCAR